MAALLPVDADEAFAKSSHANLAIRDPPTGHESAVNAIVDHFGALEVDFVLPAVLIRVDDVLPKDVGKILRGVLHGFLGLGPLGLRDLRCHPSSHSRALNLRCLHQIGLASGLLGSPVTILIIRAPFFRAGYFIREPRAQKKG